LNTAERNLELSLDQPGSAGPVTLRYGSYLATIIIGVAVIIIFFGKVQLPAYPQFTIFHAGFVILVDTLVAVQLLGQFNYRRLPVYALLAAAYLFSGLLTVFFLLSFPGALTDSGSIIGSSQSAIWTWHIWHIVFPVIVALALLVHQHAPNQLVAEEKIVPRIRLTLCTVAVLLLLAVATVTILHDNLPVLITDEQVTLPPMFYVVGGIAAACTVFALILAISQLRQRSMLHLWIVVVLSAFLADVAASLGAYSRFTVGWYFGRVESMVAAAILLLVFLGEINKIYRRLTTALSNLYVSNNKLAELVSEKDTLLEELQRREDKIREMAYFDPVTKLPNRHMLADRLNSVLAQANRYHHTTAVLLLDLDNFKTTNDLFGHSAGDALLLEVATRLNQCVRSSDTVSRLGGDEFVVILPQIADTTDAVNVAEKVLKALNQPVSIAGQQIKIGSSIGIAVNAPDSDRNSSDLISLADTAMYTAKREGGNRYAFAAEPVSM